MQTVVVTETHRLSPHSNLVTAAMPGAVANSNPVPVVKTHDVPTPVGTWQR